MRNVACQFCQKQVYGVERHGLQCPVLFQASFTSRLAQTPSLEPTWNQLMDLTSEKCFKLLQGSLQVFQEVAASLLISVFCVPQSELRAICTLLVRRSGAQPAGSGSHLCALLLDHGMSTLAMLRTVTNHWQEQYTTGTCATTLRAAFLLTSLWTF